jgi:nitrogen fixation protein NifU and related proteins
MRDPETGQLVDPSQIGEGELTDEQLVYKENIIDHYRHPHNKHALAHADAHAKDMNPLCGDAIEVFVKLDGERVAAVTFQGKGCAISQAAMSMLTDELKGKTIAQVKVMSREDILGILNIPIGVVRMKCAMLGLRTTQKALEN